MAAASVALPDKTLGAEALAVEPWMKTPGSPFVAYGQPSRYANKVARIFASAPGTTGTGTSRTPHHLLDGMITPNGLHFERHHSGIPEIDPQAHRLLIHGLVKRPLIFTLDALNRYPMESRIAFVECAGNSALLYQKEPAQLGVQPIHGLLSCAEWTGVRLATLLEEAGVDPKAQWLLMRLLLPGYEGNMQVKWLRRIKLTEGPTMTKDETSKYTILRDDGKALQFYFPQEAKSIITRPSPGMTLNAAGLYEISGLAWSGNGKISKVDVSADGGSSWATAALQEPVLPKAVTRFRMPWRWSGGPATLQSRASDESGYVQPTRARLIADRGARTIYHFNGIASWGVSQGGEVKHVYA